MKKILATIAILSIAANFYTYGVWFSIFDTFGSQHERVAAFKTYIPDLPIFVFSVITAALTIFSIIFFAFRARFQPMRALVVTAIIVQSAFLALTVWGLL